MGKRGRPTKYKGEETCVLASVLARLGATDAELAEAFEVDVDTIYEWKKVHSDFSDALKSKESADTKVKISLYKRALGYSHKSEKIFYDQKRGEVVRAEITEHYPPDPTSMIFWLKNRDPANWREKQEHEIKDGSGLTVEVHVNRKTKEKD